jgi:hypothetical protein
MKKKKDQWEEEATVAVLSLEAGKKAIPLGIDLGGLLAQ